LHNICFANAKKTIGRRLTIDEIMNEIEKDRIFYRNSQGGVTIGGGEPLSQPEFVSMLLKECKRLSNNAEVPLCD